MTDRRNQLKMAKMRHSSLDLADPEIKKKRDVLSKARNKLLLLSDALKSRKSDENQNKLPKSMTQCTLDYFVKHSQNRDNRNAGSKTALQKQTSVGAYPIEIRVSSFDNELDDDGDDNDVFYPISRLRPATVCVDSPSINRRSDAEALALERPRKKLSFKEPEVDIRKQKINSANKLKNGTIIDPNKQPSRTILNNYGDTMKNKVDSKYTEFSKSLNKFNINSKFSDKTLKNLRGGATNGSNKSDNNFSLAKGIQSMAGLGLNVVSNGISRTHENPEDQSQAMRVVRTVGQAFEVCHKLQIGAPEDNLDDDQDTTLTQDFCSDRFSDAASDKPKKDIILDGANSDKNSLPADDYSLRVSHLDNSIKNSKPPAHIDILPPPPSNSNSSRKSPLQAETYSAPHSDGLASSTNTGSISNSLPPPGGALSSHHEIQLLREQLDQQRQQTQAAIAQLQLAREQLQAEQTARMEAQARTHQLLVHNRELLDHIAALVAHLQGGDKPGQQSSPPHMTMPQHQATQETIPEQPSPQLDPNIILQALGIAPPGILENRAATSCQSPLRSTFSPGSGTIFNYQPYQPSPLQVDPSFETQLLQRLQALGGYPSLTPQYQYGLPLLTQGLYNQALLNNNYPLQNPNPYNMGSTHYATLPRTFANLESRLNASRHSEPRHIPSLYQQKFTPSQETGQTASTYKLPNQEQFQQYSPPNYEQNSTGTTNKLSNQDQYQHYNYDPNSAEPYEKPNYPASSSQSGPQLTVPNIQRRHSALNLNKLQPDNLQTIPQGQRLEHGHDTRTPRGVTPQRILSPPPVDANRDTKFIKPKTEMGNSGNTNLTEEEADLLTNLRMNEELRLLNGPGISRSASERVPNRSELMSQVQRTMWARHTTK